MDIFKPKRDYIADWFICHEENGDKMFMRGVRHDLKSGEDHWMIRHHKDTDGLSFFVDEMRLVGYDNLSYTVASKNFDLSWWRKIKVFIKTFKGKKPIITEWKQPLLQVPYDQENAVWGYFAEDQSKKIERSAKRNGVNLSTYLLWTLSQELNFLIKNPEQDTQYWVFPFNMRGLVSVISPMANQAAFVEVPVKPGDTAKTIFRSIQASISSEQYWAFWLIMSLGRLTGINFIRKFFKALRKKNVCHFGTYTFYGHWPPKTVTNQRYKDEIWTGFPPVTKAQPISCGAMIWDGKLTLSLNIHPATGLDKRQGQQLLEKIKKRLEHEAEQVTHGKS